MVVATAPPPAPRPPEPVEIHLRRFFDKRDVDVDAQAVVFGLFRAQADVFSAIERAALRPLRLTHASFTTLMTLWIVGPLETRRLATALGVSRPSVVSVVNTLEGRDLVRRIRSDVDRRLVTVEVTPAGDRLVARAQREAHKYERRFTSAMSLPEQRTLARLLKKLDAAARDMLDEQPPTAARNHR